MKTLREQIADKCRHFTGTQNKTCDAGVTYFAFRDTDGKRPSFANLPCFAGEGRIACERRSFLTAEEVEAEVAECDRSFEAFGKARAAIVATKKESGTVDCPKCGTPDALRFRVSSYNRHIHAACATAGCLSWME